MISNLRPILSILFIHVEALRFFVCGHSVVSILVYLNSMISEVMGRDLDGGSQVKKTRRPVQGGCLPLPRVTRLSGSQLAEVAALFGANNSLDGIIHLGYNPDVGEEPWMRLRLIA
jgi:hypothetical protein